MPQPPELTLAAGDQRITIDAVDGGRLQRWEVAGHELLAAHGAEPVEHGMYAMAPWAGRLRGNALRWQDREHAFTPSYAEWAIHGLTPSASAEFVDQGQDDDHAWATVRLAHDPGWPWPMRIELEYHLQPRQLVTVIRVEALDAEFPVVVGWHPWFRRHLDAGGPLRWHVAARQQVERGADHLPTGRLVEADLSAGPFDDAFLVPDGQAQVTWPGVLGIEIRNDAPWYVVFDELPDAVCVEPQSGPPNGINDGLGLPIPVASPGQPHELTTAWVIRDDPPAE